MAIITKKPGILTLAIYTIIKCIAHIVDEYAKQIIPYLVTAPSQFLFGVKTFIPTVRIFTAPLLKIAHSTLFYGMRVKRVHSVK